MWFLRFFSYFLGIFYGLGPNFYGGGGPVTLLFPGAFFFYPLGKVSNFPEFLIVIWFLPPIVFFSFNFSGAKLENPQKKSFFFPPPQTPPKYNFF